MAKFINKFLNIILIILISFLILNRYYVVNFSATLRNVFIYLSLIIILTNSLCQIIKGSGAAKAIGFIIFFSAVIGGIWAVITKKINFLIFICILFSLVNSILELSYSKS